MYSKTFTQLTKDELYALLTLRQQVFVVEQQSIYLDLDDLDQQAMHYLDFDAKGNLHTYARYRPTEVTNEVNIERVVLAKDYRAKGKGKQLINTILADILQVNPHAKIKLSSQLYACEFYQKLGFVEFGEAYDDGGIMHIGMLYHPGDKPLMP